MTLHQRSATTSSVRTTVSGAVGGLAVPVVVGELTVKLEFATPISYTAQMSEWEPILFALVPVSLHSQSNATPSHAQFGRNGQLGVIVPLAVKQETDLRELI